ncbi:MAG: DUF2089 family protein [Oscillospiraceae bacterium]|nr:DUF2089 family protein [Oscillospiraceae bacterium]
MMASILTKCPVCNGALTIKTLQCTSCGLELKNDFEPSPFDRLDAEKSTFLLTFLKCRGNMSLVQNELQLSYPSARKKLSDLLAALELADTDSDEQKEEELDMQNWVTDPNSTKASEIIKTKLKESGGRAIVHSISGVAYEIKAEPDGKSFSTEALPIKPNYTYDVFDVIVDLLLSQGGRAKKGLARARNARLGDPNFEETTVVGAIAKNYLGRKVGESSFDPVFALAAVLEWAGIAHNERGYLELTADYLRRREQ